MNEPEVAQIEDESSAKNVTVTPAFRRRRRYVVMGLSTLLAVLVAVSFTLLAFGPKTSSYGVVEDTTSPVVVTAMRPFYVLIIGSDTRKGTALYTGNASEHAQVDEHADVMTLVRVDPQNHVLTFVTVPCDTVPWNQSAKINDSLLSGDPQQTVTAVEGITGVDIDYYVMTTFTGFESFIDAIGGVMVDVPVKSSIQDPLTTKTVTVKAGNNQTLNGSQALVISHAWKQYASDQDAHRQVNVRAVETGIISRALNMDEAELRSAVASLEEDTTTNMDATTLVSLAVDFWNNRRTATLYTCTGPYDEVATDDDTVMIPEQKSVWRQLMSVVDAGDDPEGIVPEPSTN